MRNKTATIVVAFAMAFGALCTSAMAMNFGVGVSSAYTNLDTSGSETLKQSSAVASGSHDNNVVIPALFLEIGTDMGFVLGYKIIPGEADLGSKTTTRGDKLKGTADAAVTVDQVVQAQVQNVKTIYVETPGFTSLGLFATVGYTEFDVLTNETLGTGAAYGDTSMDGYMYGLGMKHTFDTGFFLKAMATYTDFDSVSLSSTGSDAVSTIDAEVESNGAEVAMGFKF